MWDPKIQNIYNSKESKILPRYIEGQRNSIRKYFFKIFILEQYVDDKWAGIKDLSSIIFYGISLQLDKFVKP